MKVEKSLIRKINQKKIISRNELFELIKLYHDDVSKSYFYKIISDLIEKDILVKVDSDTYSIEKKQLFTYTLSDEKIEAIVEPYGDYLIWDTNIFNKWMNHLLNVVVTFIEVDKELMYLLADELKEKGYSHVLVNPSVNEFFKYSGNQTIIIKPLTKSLSEKDHHISIEKLIIELYSNKITNSLYGDIELKTMLNEIFKNYQVDLNRTFHLSKRKKIYDEYHMYLTKNVNKGYLYHD